MLTVQSMKLSKDKKDSFILLVMSLSFHLRMTAKQGDDVTLTCSVRGTPKPTIIWSKVGEDLNSRNIAVDREQLRLTNAKVTDRGVYVCTVENKAGKSRASAVLEVDRR